MKPRTKKREKKQTPSLPPIERDIRNGRGPAGFPPKLNIPPNVRATFGHIYVGY